MYKKILVPTDGSKLSVDAAKHAISLAKAVGASLVSFFAAPAYPMLVYGEAIVVDPVSPEQYEADAAKMAAKHTDVVKHLAEAQGVACEAAYALHDTPWEAIVEAASKHHCDLVVMASHGRRGLVGVLLGSETQRVLIHSKLPVLVFRE